VMLLAGAGAAGCAWFVLPLPMMQKQHKTIAHHSSLDDRAT
jgi:hypothetical protein